jgi:threonine/homoserine/homoserine lactone efflux protein
MKSLLMTLGVLLGLVLCVSGIAGALATGLDPVYGGIGLLIALAGGALLLWFGTGIRRASRAEAEGAPGKRSRQKPSVRPKPLDKGQRL